jgi:hypothetical protein
MAAVGKNMAPLSRMGFSAWVHPTGSAGLIHSVSSCPALPFLPTGFLWETLIQPGSESTPWQQPVHLRAARSHTLAPCPPQTQQSASFLPSTIPSSPPRFLSPTPCSLLSILLTLHSTFCTLLVSHKLPCTLNCFMGAQCLSPNVLCVLGRSFCVSVKCTYLRIECLRKYLLNEIISLIWKCWQNVAS